MCFVEGIEKENMTAFMTILDELGGWPILGTATGGNWNETSFNLNDLLLFSSSFAFFAWKFAPDQNTPTDNMFICKYFIDTTALFVFFFL